MNEIIEILATSCLHSLWIGALVAGLLGMFLNVVSESRSEIRYAVAWLSLISVVMLSVFMTVNSRPIFDLRVQVSPTVQFVIATAWMVGCTVSCVRFVKAWFAILAMRRRSLPVDDVAICGVFDSVKDRVGIRRKIRLYSSELISGPVLIGWLSPMVLIPTGWVSGVPTSHLAAIFAHELAHARRLDFFANLVQRGMEAVMFFNPAVWWISSVIRREREHACDDSAVRMVDGASPYSRALVWFEDHRTTSNNPNELALAFGNGRSISGRISRLLRVSNDQKKLSPIVAISGVSILALTFVLVAVLISGTRLFAESSEELEEMMSPVIVPRSGGVEIDHPFDLPSVSDALDREILWRTFDRPLFVSVPILKKNNSLICVENDYPRVFSALPNGYLLKNELDFLDGNLPNRDLDGDGFSVVEEYQAGTDPRDPGAHPAYVEKLEFKGRKMQAYKVTFQGRPDAKRFQLGRVPTVKWPNRKTFIVTSGEMTPDGQLKIGKLIEQKEVVNGIIRDASFLEVTFLPKKEKLKLQRNVMKNIPTFFAELESTIPTAKTFYVKEGEEFTVPGDPDKWTLREVNENSCTIFREGEGGKTIVKTFTKTK